MLQVLTTQFSSYIETVETLKLKRRAESEPPRRQNMSELASIVESGLYVGGADSDYSPNSDLNFLDEYL